MLYHGGQITENVEVFKNSMFNISYNKYLKEFIIQNPPDFRISKKCCTYAKKKDLKVIEENEPLLYIACNTIFKESYTYTQKYKSFCEKMKM